jgi:hypothetical protein
MVGGCLGGGGRRDSRRRGRDGRCAGRDSGWDGQCWRGHSRRCVVACKSTGCHRQKEQNNNLVLHLLHTFMGTLSAYTGDRTTPNLWSSHLMVCGLPHVLCGVLAGGRPWTRLACTLPHIVPTQRLRSGQVCPSGGTGGSRKNSKPAWPALFREEPSCLFHICCVFLPKFLDPHLLFLGDTSDS